MCPLYDRQANCGRILRTDGMAVERTSGAFSRSAVNMIWNSSLMVALFLRHPSGVGNTLSYITYV